MVNFTLVGLNSDVGLTASPTFPTVVGGTVTGHHFELGLSMLASSFNNVFYFNTTTPDLSSNSLTDDMEFYTNSGNWPDIAFSNGDITSSSDPSGENITSYLVTKKTKFIGPAKLAKDITGGYNNSDIFSNEDALVEQYVTLDTNLKNAIGTNLDLGGDNSNRKTNNNNDAANVSREVLLNLLNGTAADVQRVNALLEAKANDTDDVALTFATDDTIVFEVKYTVGGITTPGQNPVTDQKFRVTITLT